MHTSAIELLCGGVLKKIGGPEHRPQEAVSLIPSSKSSSNFVNRPDEVQASCLGV